jgi:hypothetical protein
MRDDQIVQLAGTQFNRVSRAQLRDLGLNDLAIDRRLKRRRLVVVEEGVFAVPPLLPDEWGVWMGATLTQEGTRLCRFSAMAAYGLWRPPRRYETVVRPGNGGPRRHGNLIVYRSQTLERDCTKLRNIPIVTAERALFEVSGVLSERALARAVRDAVRLGHTSLPRIGDLLDRHKGERGSRRLKDTIARYSGLPLQRARSGAEIRALELLREAGRPMARLNYRIGGEEADLSWPQERLIIEVDGAPFHQDVGEDARKEAAWRSAGWEVQRISADDVYHHPVRFLQLAPR